MFLSRRYLICAALILLAAGAALLVWTEWKLPQKKVDLVISADQLAPLAGERAGRRSIVTYPAIMRWGDPGSVSLELLPITTNQAQATPTSNLHAEAEARLEIPGVAVIPGDISSTSMLPGRSVKFEWTIQPVELGLRQGRAWVYVRLISTDGTTDEQRALAAPPIEIQVESLAGITTPVVRILGIICVVIGGILGGFLLVKKRS